MIRLKILTDYSSWLLYILVDSNLKFTHGILLISNLQSIGDVQHCLYSYIRFCILPTSDHLTTFPLNTTGAFPVDTSHRHVTDLANKWDHINNSIWILYKHLGSPLIIFQQRRMLENIFIPFPSKPSPGWLVISLPGLHQLFCEYGRKCSCDFSYYGWMLLNHIPTRKYRTQKEH